MNSNPLLHALKRVIGGGGLTSTESEEAIAFILDEAAADAATAAFLTALHIKGENPQELLGAVRAIRSRMIAFDRDVTGEYLDTCGTGGDGAHTVNVSTAAAIVVASCGVRVIKHGNRAASGRSGSSDVLKSLGIAVDVEVPVLQRCLHRLGIAFLFAPRFHPGLSEVAPVRRQLPFHTIFNLVGPLCNPASPSFQLVGVPREDQARRMAEVLAGTDRVRRAIVVTGSDGLDEVTLGGPTWVRIIEASTVREQVWTPEEFGLPRVAAYQLEVSSALESAALLRRMIEGEAGPVRDIVLANAAAALWTINPCPLTQAVSRAAQAIDSGAAARLVDRWSELTRSGPSML